MKKLLVFIYLLWPFLLAAQDWNIDWYGSLRGAGSTGQYMPFWARTGEDGILPVTSSGLAAVGADISYADKKGWHFDAGVNLAGAAAMPSPLNISKVYGMVDRLYVGGGWKMLHLDVGMRPRQRELSDVSISGGNIMYSRNARNIPGVNLWTDWIYFEKGHWVGVKGNISHYQTIDNRYVPHTMLHNKSLAFKISLWSKVELVAGLEHWAQWGGVSSDPNKGRQPVSISDYWKIFMAGKGGEDATKSDQVNVLGNHLGRELLRVNWNHQAFTMSLQYDKPFEDGSGMKYKNAPDGIWSVQYMSRNRDAWVTDIVLEYIGTTWQSGPIHDRPATEEEMAKQDPTDHYYGKVVLGGQDDYFWHATYRSGWTNAGRTIGLPLMLPAAPKENGAVKYFLLSRIRGCHLGLKGVISEKIPYSLKATYTKNYGRYNQAVWPFGDNKPWQLSLAFETVIGQRIWKKLPMDVSVGVYGDLGELYPDSFGFTLKLAYLDSRKF